MKDFLDYITKGPGSKPEEVQRLLFELIDHLPVALFCKDAQREYRFVSWNKAAENLWGLRRADVIGKNDYDFFPREQADLFNKVDRQVVEAGDQISIPEEAVDTQGRGRVWVRTSKVSIPDADGKARYLLGISEDITDRVETKRTLEEERVKALHGAKLATLGEMAAGIAHEINNPLAIILGRASQIEWHVNHRPRDKRALLEIGEKIEATVLRISKIIKGLRAFAREGERDPFEPVNIRTVIEDTLEFCRERFKFHGIDFQVGEFPSFEVFGRPTQLGQVLLNLLNNAHDAVAGRSTRWVRLDVTSVSDQIELAVTDSGGGIPESLRDKIMQPFFTTKDVGKGTGLGLSIAKGIIESHGGTISLKPNSPNTCFVVRLPRNKSAKAA